MNPGRSGGENFLLQNSVPPFQNCLNHLLCSIQNLWYVSIFPYQCRLYSYSGIKTFCVSCPHVFPVTILSYFPKRSCILFLESGTPCTNFPCITVSKPPTSESHVPIFPVLQPLHAPRHNSQSPKCTYLNPCNENLLTPSAPAFLVNGTYQPRALL